MNEESISLRISREELATVLDLLNVPSLPGTGERFLEGLTEDERATVLVAGRHGLRARGWLEETKNPDTGEIQFTLNPVLLALVGECIRADAITLIVRNGPTPPPATWYLHHGPFLYVIHRMVAGGVHEFFGAVSATEIQRSVLALFPFAQTDIDQKETASSPAFRLSQSRLDEVIDQVQKAQLSMAAQSLQMEGLEQVAAHTFVTALQEVEANSMLARLELASESTALTASLSFSLIETPSSVWMLRPGAPGEETLLQVEPVSGAVFTQWIGQLVE